MKELNNLVQ